jgi:hypothetical protein
MVCRQGASKPVNHMSRTITMRKGSSLSLNRFAMARRFSLLQPREPSGATEMDNAQRWAQPD